MDNEISTALQNWIPYQLFFENGEPLCQWLDLGGAEFTEPFFSSTINKRRHTGTNSARIKCISNIEVLDDWSKQIQTLEPDAIIFHVSRCGSTTVSQLMALNPENILLSEVPFFDELLRWERSQNVREQASAESLRAAIAFYGAKRKPVNKRLFIKPDSWHTLFYHQFRTAFPKTAFILLYRRPDEVIRSHQKARGMQSVQGLLEPELFGFDKNEIFHISFDEYMALVLEKYFDAFLEIAEQDPLATLVNFNEGAIKIVEKLAVASNYIITDGEMVKMRERVKFHGKYPEQLFSEEVIQTEAPGYLDRAFRLYEELEKKRKSTRSFEN